MPIKEILLSYFDFSSKDYYLYPIYDEKGGLLYDEIHVINGEEIYHVFTEENAQKVLDINRTLQIQKIKEEIPLRWHEFCDFDRAARELFPEVEDLYNYMDTVTIDDTLYYIGGYE